jgi:hypothetical protein
METSFEVENRDRVTRAEAATRLRRIANPLSSEDEEVEFERGERARDRAQVVTLRLRRSLISRLFTLASA